jgi:hypothetical protein
MSSLEGKNCGTKHKMEETFRKSGQICIPLHTFKNSVPTSQNAHCFPIIRTSRLTLFREIVVYSENHMKPSEVQCLNAGGTWAYNKLYILKG